MLVIGTTLCGDWAAVPSILAETCPPLQGDNTWYVPVSSCDLHCFDIFEVIKSAIADSESYTTYVINDQEATYANAYFELNYINVFSTSTSGSASGSGSNDSSTGSTTSQRATTTISTGPGASNALASDSIRPNAGNKRFRGLADVTKGGVVGGIVMGLMGLVGMGLVL